MPTTFDHPVRNSLYVMIVLHLMISILKIILLSFSNKVSVSCQFKSHMGRRVIWWAIILWRYTSQWYMWKGVELYFFSNKLNIARNQMHWLGAEWQISTQQSPITQLDEMSKINSIYDNNIWNCKRCAAFIPFCKRLN